MLTSSYPKFRGDTTAPFIESIATHIAAQGVEVHVVLPEHRELRRGAVEDGVHFHPYRYAPRRDWTLWGYAEALRADVQLKRGVYALAPLAIASSLARMLGLTARERFDLIHAHWVLPNAPAAALAARVRGLPLVVSLHGSDVFMAEKNGVFAAAARASFAQAARVTACSDDLLRRAIALGADEGRIEWIPYGADAKAFHAVPGAADALRAKLGFARETVMLLAVGRMVYKKGFGVLVRAMPGVLRRAPNVRLVLAGYGDLRDELEAEARALGLNGCVLFAGRVPRGEIPSYFSAADVVVVPSVKDPAGNVDGLPNVLLEGMAAGKAIVASNIAGFPDVLGGGAGGVLVPEQDPDALADAIVELARDPVRRAELGARGRAQVRSRLNWESVAAEFIQVYGAATGSATAVGSGAATGSTPARRDAQ